MGSKILTCNTEIKKPIQKSEDIQPIKTEIFYADLEDEELKKYVREIYLNTDNGNAYNEYGKRLFGLVS